MKELLFIMAEVLPTDHLVTQIKEAAEAWEIVPSEENLKKLHLSCVILSTKLSMKDKGAMAALKEIDKIEEAVKLTERIAPTN